ncbi:polysaccharide biosynthesis tyrosine autokinase [Sphingomonas naphthae]|uniref:non-specific protein-tyrosine kinase n=1 Tax=Sphingomonas naphthae TaxID=1813468 RepID=A0ABY7TMA0_9SPHN|nr:polysaccharide biosynthesis tyrosine autokinase [Sphingomonas naphthae]WCT74121.1 polysaccharide biosynthesis tyrosine autokinase [Sphingomonas naphthae]
MAAAAGFADGISAEEESGIDLGGVLRFLRRRWAWILGTAVVVALVAGLALLQVTPRYSATASVAVQTQKTQVVDIQDVVQGLTPDVATMETQASILRSMRLSELVMNRLKLDTDPEFNPTLKQTTGFRLLKPSTWFGSAPEPVLTTYQKARIRSSIIARVQKAFGIAPVLKSYVINIAATSEDPEKSAAMANTLADLYISDGIEAKYDATKRASAYLESRVEELRQAAVESDRQVEAYRGSARLVSSDMGTVDTQQLSEINSQLILARSERAAKEAQLNQLRSLTSRGGNGVDTAAAVISSPLVQALRQQESEVVRKLGDLQATYGDRHPRIINAQSELRDLRSKIEDEVRKLAAATSNEVQVARAREGTLSGSLGSIEGRVVRGGQASVRLRELQREADANRGIYETFLNRLKETRQQVDVQTADSRIISSANVPVRPSFPQVGQTLALALVGGMIAGIVLSLGLERLDNTVRGADAVEAIGGGTTLAFIPIVKGDYDRPEDIVIERPQAMAAESLRTLRSAIALSDVDTPPKVVMLSSSVPAEGKTFVSTGLARVSAQSGLRTIIIDADMRHPRVHHAFGMENKAGLVQVLSGETSLASVLQRDAGTGVDVLSAGHGAVNPPDLLRSHHMEQLVQRLRDTYDFVVIDTPPFTPMTDSQIVSRLVDKMLLVVRWGHTPVPVVQTTLRQVHRIGAPLVGSVLSQVNLQRQATYGYGDYGYHYSRYGAYYGASA